MWVHSASCSRTRILACGNMSLLVAWIDLEAFRPRFRDLAIGVSCRAPLGCWTLTPSICLQQAGQSLS